MFENSKEDCIPSRYPKQDKRVGIYCRVNTNREKQLKNLAIELSRLTKLTADTPQWSLVDVYMDVASSKEVFQRKAFERMVEDCKLQKLDVILTKSINKFGSDSADTIDAVKQLKILGISVVFEQESVDTSIIDIDLIITLIENMPQVKKMCRGEKIKSGIKKRAALGTSKLYNRKCYGYKNDADGSLFIDIEEAKNVKIIYDLYLKGKSIMAIVHELEQLKIKSPTGKDKWSKRMIDVMLSNEKYTGSVILLDNGKHEIVYLCKNNNPIIISREIFQAVQAEKIKRSKRVKNKAMI